MDKNIASYLKSSYNLILPTINKFFNSFDTQNWAKMKECLSEHLVLDYQSFRGTPPYESTAQDYIAKRKKGLNNLNTTHHTFDHSITATNIEEEFLCKCSFEIKRYEKNSQEYFHSFGSYEIVLKRVNAKFKISQIKQVVERNVGNRNIHGAFKTKNKD